MGQALYRKYRSKSLAEIIGQEHITQTLSKALKSGRISHAYLFTGPRGVGKTSIARILAHEINGLPYQDDSSHMDIIEIDAASNRRIDEIRDLRDKVAVAPTSAKYKVYIIDEVHMLTKEAFNALLKTLEEPPAHVIFILATTDAHKLPSTIVSRTQRYTFKPVSANQVSAHLRFIADKENIAADDDALELLATHGEGSFRDSISMLDQASGHNSRLTLEFVQTLLGIPPVDAINNIIRSLQSNDAPAVAHHLAQLYDQGYTAAAIAKIIGNVLRNRWLAGDALLSGKQLLDLLAKLLEVAPSHDPQRLLEIILIENASATDASPDTNSPPISPVTPVAVQRLPQPPEKLIKTVKIVEQKLLTVQLQSVVDEALWPKVLTALKQKYNTLYGVVRMADPTFNGSELELAFSFAFHQKRLNDPKNKKIVADIIYELSGQAVHINCVLRKSDVNTSKAAVPEHDIKTISDIFGGGEIIK